MSVPKEPMDTERTVGQVDDDASETLAVEETVAHLRDLTIRIREATAGLEESFDRWLGARRGA